MIVNGVNYHVELSGDGIPLVLLHGFMGSAVNWLPHIPIFEQHFRVITIDLPGHGKSDSPSDPQRYSMDNVAQDLITIFEQLPLPPVRLLGYSMGGRLALYLAAHHPSAIESLILESASPGLEPQNERAERQRSDEQLANRIEENGVPAFVAEWERLPLFATQDRLPAIILDQQRSHRLRNNPHGLANSLRGMGTGVQPSLWPRLSTISKPVLLIAGELDTKFVAIAHRMNHQIPASRLAIIPDAGHTTHLEQPDWFVSHVLEFRE
jgi:2-succinyl-6-hydroxy-2,4-cyclohexadiene-1-carboxylate synthase